MKFKVFDHASRLRMRAVALVGFLLLSGAAAHADSIKIVALGASNTRGHGVALEQAYPAQLEAMLRAKGYDVSVINAGVDGDTTAGMLQRLDSAVPAGTRLVLISPSANDVKHGMLAERGTYVAAIVRRLQARGIKTIVMPSLGHFEKQADGIHLTASAHRSVAAMLLPEVISVIGRVDR